MRKRWLTIVLCLVFVPVTLALAKPAPRDTGQPPPELVNDGFNDGCNNEDRQKSDESCDPCFRPSSQKGACRQRHKGDRYRFRCTGTCRGGWCRELWCKPDPGVLPPS